MTTTSPSARIRVATTVDSAVADHARWLLTQAVTTGFHDDRFDAWPSAEYESFVAALATSQTGQPIAYLGGSVDRDRLRLDALIAPGTPEPAAVLNDLYAALTSHLATDDTSSEQARTVEIWCRPATPAHQQFAADHGLVEVRALHQMRCRLPVAAEPLPSRPYTPHTDLEALRAVNNRAFATHPDQGAKTADELLATMAETWFRPDGLLLYECEGRLAGFCWTKIHRHPTAGETVSNGYSTEEPPLTERPGVGEIFVIGIDPDFWGQGLGVPMTAAGLAWLADQGLTTGMLFVEADNTPAIRTYERLGFEIVRTDRAWVQP